jgi:hypothetical protein
MDFWILGADSVRYYVRAYEDHEGRCGWLLGAVFGAGGIAWASQMMSATADPNGTQRAATAQIDGPSNL